MKLSEIKKKAHGFPFFYWLNLKCYSVLQIMESNMICSDFFVCTRLLWKLLNNTSLVMDRKLFLG